MRILFFRHGERIERRDKLTPRGEQMAVSARAWLDERGYVPTHAIRTKRRRTRDTLASLILGTEVVPRVETVPNTKSTWLKYREDLTMWLPGEATILVVGHGDTQGVIEKLHRSPVPAGNRCAGFVLDRAADGTWACTDRYPGSPTTGEEMQGDGGGPLRAYLSEEDEALLGRVWDEIGREEPARKPRPVKPRLRQPLPEGKLAIIGDIHGELAALESLLRQLGVDANQPKADRTLVFVGDLVDRGPDSPGVVALVQRLVEAGVAVAVLGNHELNHLRGKKKLGGGWLHGEEESDKEHRKYTSVLANDRQRKSILRFLRSIPLVLERADLQVVHACPLPIAELPTASSVADACEGSEKRIRAEFEAAFLDQAAAGEKALQGGAKTWTDAIRASASWEVAKQNRNPVKVLTSGVEGEADQPFTDENGQVRAVQRLPWWLEWRGKQTVVGHFWRERDGEQDKIFAGLEPFQWCNGVFVVDYSVGRRYQERAAGEAEGHGLAALLWPERTLVFDDGTEHMTQEFTDRDVRGAL